MSFRLLSAPGNKFAYLKLWNKLARDDHTKITNQIIIHPLAMFVCVYVHVPYRKGILSLALLS